MKNTGIITSCFFLATNSFAQGGWVFDTNPANETTDYTTNYTYVGCSFIDLDADNYVDLFLAPGTLFINNADGTFSKILPLPFAPLNGTIGGSSSADLDNDGDNDFIISAVPSKVFFNLGNGTFKDSSANVPSFSGYHSWGAAIGDYNEDKLLDFVFAHANGFFPTPTPCKFYSQGPATFNPVPVSVYPFTTDLDTYTNPYWSDYDLDGDMDLFIASGPVMGTPDYDHCYKNMKIETGNDTLIQMTTELFATQKQDGQCYNFIDYDSDGDLDLCLTNYLSAPTRLYQNNGGIYTTVSTPFTNTTTNIANCWGDYDNDGDLDVIITNDNQVSKYYRNNGGVSFSYLSAGFSTPTATNGVTNADYDNDGDLDIFTNGLGNNGNTTSVGLFINDTVAGNRSFVNLKLVGVVSNTSAIGAIVRLYATIYGNPVWQMREVNAQNSFQGQNDLRVHFGLGDATMIDSLTITWPSGNVDSYSNYPSNSFYKITESTGVINLSTQKSTVTPNSVKLFPIPTSNILNVELIGFPKDEVVYHLSNILGKMVMSGKASHLNFNIDIGHLPSGVYIFNIRSQQGIASKRIIKL